MRYFHLFVAFIFPYYAFSEIIGSPVATVKLTENEAIYKKDLDRKVELYQKSTGQALGKEDKLKLLDSEISGVLIRQAAKSEGIKILPQEVTVEIEKQRNSQPQTKNLSASQFKTFIESQGLLYEDYKKEIENSLIVQKYIRKHSDNNTSSANPNEAEIQDFYDQNTNLFVSPKMLKIEQVFRDTTTLSPSDTQKTKSEFDAYYARIKSGGKKEFDLIVVSLLGKDGYTVGDSGYLVLSAQEKEYYDKLFGIGFVDKVSSIKSGAFSEVLKSNVGYHIVYVSKIEMPRLLTLDDKIPGQDVKVRDKISDFISLQKQNQAMQKSIEKIIAELKKKANITINKDLI